MRGKLDKPPSDRAISHLALRQHGLVTTRQLAEAGVDSAGLSRRIRAHRLHRVHRGVFAVGHARLSREARWLAAVLTCGRDAVLSHRSAAAFWGLRPQSSGPIEVTVAGTGGRAKRPGLLIHRSTCLVPAQTTRARAIPVTTPARTVADLRRILPADQLGAALRRAEVLRLDVGAQHGYESDNARSELERMILRVCGENRLPMPEVNANIGPYYVDFLWRDRRLAVEADSWTYHGTRSAFEADRKRDVDLRLMGLTCLRFTYRQVADAEGFSATLRAVLLRSA